MSRRHERPGEAFGPGDLPPPAAADNGEGGENGRIAPVHRLARIGAAIGLAITAPALASCDGDGGSTPTSAPEPSAVFLEPEDGSEQIGNVTATVELDDFVIHAADIGEPNRPGQGYLRFIIDGGRFDKRRYAGASGELARQLGTEGRYSPAVEASITYRCLPLGDHTLVVELLNNDGTPAGASDSVTFTITGRRPGCLRRPRGEEPPTGEEPGGE